MMIEEDIVIDRDRRLTMEVILARDQRTTSHRVLDRSHQGANGGSARIMKMENMISTRKSSNIYTDQYNESYVTRKEGKDLVQRHLRYDSYLVQDSYDDRGVRSRRNASVSTTTWLRFGSLLVTLLVVSIHGAPTMTLEDRRLTSPQKWVNPCGLAAEDLNGDLDVMRLRDEQLLSQVVVQAKTALMHAQLFRDDYVKRTFNVDFADLHSTWKDNHYDWLPSLKEIPKHLGDPLDQEFLSKLELDTALIDAYEYMQKYAVGLEQIVWDQEDHHLEFRDQFKETEFKLRSVLCELQVALFERQITPRPDVQRDVMSSEYRAMSTSATYRDLRDWLIFRDYMNGLEYVIQVFEHLLRGLES